MELDVQRIAESLMIVMIAGGVTWIFGKTLKNARDKNEAFYRIRRLNRQVFPDDKDEPKKRKSRLLS